MGIISKVIRRHESTATEHPIFVSPQGVDFAIVAHHADGLGAFPARECIRGESRMHQRHVGDEGGIFYIQVVLGDLLGCQLTLVGDGLRGEGIDVKSRFGTEHGGCLFFGHFAYTEEFTFEVTGGLFFGTRVGNEELGCDVGYG